MNKAINLILTIIPYVAFWTFVIAILFMFFTITSSFIAHFTPEWNFGFETLKTFAAILPGASTFGLLIIAVLARNDWLKPIHYKDQKKILYDAKYQARVIKDKITDFFYSFEEAYAYQYGPTTALSLPDEDIRKSQFDEAEIAFIEKTSSLRTIITQIDELELPNFDEDQLQNKITSLRVAIIRATRKAIYLHNTKGFFEPDDNFTLTDLEHFGYTTQQIKLIQEYWKHKTEAITLAIDLHEELSNFYNATKKH